MRFYLLLRLASEISNEIFCDCCVKQLLMGLLIDAFADHVRDQEGWPASARSGLKALS
jgi:hypothetical protein